MNGNPLKHPRETMPEIARELGVLNVVEGLVIRRGLRVRITLQLIALPVERHLWSESYSRKLADPLPLQAAIARKAAAAIKRHLLAAD